jgi:hypothetical protein
VLELEGIAIIGECMEMPQIIAAEEDVVKRGVK